MKQKKFIIGGILLIGAVIFLIASSTISSSRYYMTVDELFEYGDAIVDKPVQVMGVVVGDPIVSEADSLGLTFTMAHLPLDKRVLEAEGGLEAALDAAVNDSQRNRVQVEYEGASPDLLQHKAQVIVTGRLGEDGILHAEELLMKCPSRYEALPSE